MKTRILLLVGLLGISAYSFCQTNTNTGTGAGNSGNDNTSIGYKAGDVVTNSGNVFVGSEAGLLNTSGSPNSFVGRQAGKSNTTGINNTYFGYNAGFSNVTGNYNVGVGHLAGFSSTTDGNIFLGAWAGSSNISGQSNVFLGYFSGRYSTGSGNVFLGYASGRSSTGSNNVFIGNSAGYSETASNKLYIENSNSSLPLIYGDFATDKVGINSLPNTTHTLTVGGTIHSTGLYVNGVLVSGDLSLWERSGTNVFTQSTADNIGIGTTLSNNPNSYKLAVNGKIGAKEVQIENSSLTWPDFVFKSDYKLMSLTEVEAFIKANGHLPEVPSEKQVAAEGIKVSELNAKLLQKIEELTLYVIELKKEVEVLKRNKE